MYKDQGNYCFEYGLSIQCVAMEHYSYKVYNMAQDEYRFTTVLWNLLDANNDTMVDMLIEDLQVLIILIIIEIIDYLN